MKYDVIWRIEYAQSGPIDNGVPDTYCRVTIWAGSGPGADKFIGFGSTPHDAYSDAINQLVIKPAFMDPPPIASGHAVDLSLAMELGYKYCERGLNITAAHQELASTLDREVVKP